jgi:low affinity Fe/Cu permease
MLLPGRPLEATHFKYWHEDCFYDLRLSQDLAPCSPLIQETIFMCKPQRQEMTRLFEMLAHKATMWTGSSSAFLLAFALTVGWLVSGPFYGYSDTWQLVMNTVSSVVTFLMVFLIQRSQNKDSMAIQVKLNELIGATKGASNRLINIEDLTEDELMELHARYQQLAERMQQKTKITAAVSIEQAAKDNKPLPPNGQWGQSPLGTRDQTP